MFGSWRTRLEEGSPLAVKQRLRELRLARQVGLEPPAFPLTAELRQLDFTFRLRLTWRVLNEQIRSKPLVAVPGFP